MTRGTAATLDKIILQCDQCTSLIEMPIMREIDSTPLRAYDAVVKISLPDVDELNCLVVEHQAAGCKFPNLSVLRPV